MKDRRLVLEFSKMQGAGNDFVVIDNRFYHFPSEKLSRLAQAVCERRTSIGADGLLALEAPPEDGDAAWHFRMRYYNRDGSVGTMCGNGARCLAKFAQESGIESDPLVFLTDSGIYRATVSEKSPENVRLYWPGVKDFTPDILQIDTETGPMNAHYLFTGVEHAVIFVDSLKDLDVDTLGKRVRWHSRLEPSGANVNFVEVGERSENHTVVFTRTFEKGVEQETKACGTGALAGGLVARLLEKVDTDSVSVRMEGGVLDVGFKWDGTSLTNIYQEGPAKLVFRGTMYV